MSLVVEHTGNFERHWRSQDTRLKGGVGEAREGSSSLGAKPSTKTAVKEERL